MAVTGTGWKNGSRRKSAIRSGMIAASTAAVAVVSTSTSIAATGTPITNLTGWNVKQIYTGPGSVTAAFDSANNYDYFTTNATGNNTGIGLPSNGTITSAASGDTGVTFQLQPFTQSNALELQSVSGTAHPGPNGTSALLTGTLNFPSPVAYSSLSLLDADANGGTTISYTLTYNTGTGTTTTSTGTFAGTDWFGTGGAISNIGRVGNAYGGGTPTYNTGTDPELYESDITIPTADQIYAVQSIAFTIPAGTGGGPEWSVFAISGQTASKIYVYSAATDPNTFDTTTSNFKLSGTSTTFVNGVTSTALFDDTAASTNGTHTVSVASGGVSPGAVLFNNSSTSYTLNGPGGIVGTGSVSVNSGGTVTFNNSNTYTGLTTINSGTLNLGSSGSIAGSSVILTSSGTLNLAGSSYSLAGLSGAGAVNSTNGTGANLTLTGGGNYTGSLSLGSGSVTINANGSTAVFTGGNSYSGGTYLVAGAFEIGNSSSAGSGTAYLQGGSLGAVGGPVNFSNFITGGALILPANSSLLELSNSANNFAGPIIIQSGATLQVDTAGAIGGLNGGNPASGFAIVASGASLSIKDTSGVLGLTGGAAGGTPIPLTLSGTGVGGNGALTTPNNNIGTATWAGSINLSGPATIAPGIGSAIALTGAITGSGPVLYTANSADSGSSSITLAPPSATSNTYTAESQVTGDYGGTFSTITVNLGATNGFSPASGLNIVPGGTGALSVELNGYSQSVQYLTGGTNSNYQVSNTSPVTSTLSITNGNNASNVGQTFGIQIIGNIAVVKSGAGNQTFIGNSTYTGGTNVKAGTLSVGTANALGTGPVTVSGGTLAFSAPSSVTGFGTFTTNGTSAVITGNTLQLTNIVGGGYGETATAYAAQPVTINDAKGFTASFTYNPTPETYSSEADGATFIIQNSAQGSSAVGAGGGGWGYTGINKSVALIFQIFYQNTAVIAGQYVGESTNGSVPTTATASSYQFDNYGSDPINVAVTYANGVLTEVLTDTAGLAGNGAAGSTKTFSYPVDIAQQLGGSAGGTSSGYVGFTAAGGGVGATQQFSNFVFGGGGNQPVGIANSVTAAPGTTSSLQVATSTQTSTQNLGALSVGAGAILHVTLATGSTGRAVLAPTSLSIAGSPGAYTGQLDLGGSDLDVPSSGTSIAAVTSMLKQGYAGGAWTGNGIASASAAADSTHLTALGVIVNDNGSSTPLYGNNGTISTTFDGATPADGDILVKYTYYGDANLDGAVDGSDYSLIDFAYENNKTNPGSLLTGWANGDFNYDGVINGSDYTLIDNAFNQQGSSLGSNPLAQIAATVGGSAVPEPATLSLLGLGSMALLGRRRRPARTAM